MNLGFNKHNISKKSEDSKSKISLFIVCPFSKVEGLIREEHEQNSFFLTRMGARLDDMDLDTQEAVRDLIIDQKINCITLVVSADCLFIDRIISRKKLFGIGPEKILENIYIEYFNEKFRNIETEKQKIELARLYANDQLESLLSLTLLSNVLVEYDIMYIPTKPNPKWRLD